MPYTNLLPSFNENDKNHILDNIEVIFSKMPFLIAATGKEKQARLKMGEKVGPFMRKCLQLAENNSGYLPDIFSMQDFATKVEVWELLKVIQPQINKLNEAINCTTLMLEKEGVNLGCFFYKSAMIASHQNVPGAPEVVNHLSSYFPASGTKGKRKNKV
jgi:hypothetical protein